MCSVPSIGFRPFRNYFASFAVSDHVPKWCLGQREPILTATTFYFKLPASQVLIPLNYRCLGKARSLSEERDHARDMSWQLLPWISPFHSRTSGTGAWWWEVSSPSHNLGWSQRMPLCLVATATSSLQRMAQLFSITSVHWNLSPGGICKCFAYARHIWSNHGGEKAMQMLPCCLLDIRGQIFPAVAQVSSPSLIYCRKVKNWSPVTKDAIM